jgi:tripeptide aminopeptidase
VAFDTQSDSESVTAPSTEKQLALGKVLQAELEQLGLRDIRMDDHGRVFGTIPANCAAKAPVVGFLAHMDTAEEASGANVKPRLVENYDGGDIVLSPGIVTSPAQFPELRELVGKTLIVTDGTTLLGADDKAGVAEIMTMTEILMTTDRPHGEIHVSLTTDEEVGRGPDDFDVAAFGCQYGYTVDGGPLGELEYENFNAASCTVRVHGCGVHPGSAKHKMVNAALIAMEFNAMLPAGQTPALTDGYEGFLHLNGMEGGVTEAKLHYIIRDHDRVKFEEKKALTTSAAAYLNAKYGAGTVEVSLEDSYYNMREKLEPHMHLIDRAERAFAKNGVVALTQPIRGGTDGARLSFMGLPCPNLSTGGYNFHGVHEFIPVESMETMVQVLVDLACSFAEEEK